MDYDKVKKAKAGDTDALGELITDNMQAMYRVGFSILKNEDEIADAVSNTVVIVFEKISTLRVDEYFKTWLIRILMNECYKILRNNKKIVYLDNYNQEDLSYNDEYIDFEIRKIVNSLDNDLRQIVVLYYFEDFGVKEIAKIMDIPDGTVKSRLSRARAILKEKFIKEKLDERGNMNNG